MTVASENANLANSVIFLVVPYDHSAVERIKGDGISTISIYIDAVKLTLRTRDHAVVSATTR